jgi:hypothetical protein
MALEDLANIGELVSAIAVVISLAYLALQVRQNTASLRSDAYGRALDRISEMQGRFASDSGFTTFWARGALDAAALTPAERIRAMWALYEAFGAFEFMYLQHALGALPDEVWERWAKTTAWWLSHPGIRTMWHARPAPFTASFTAYVEREAMAAGADPEAQQRWVAYLRGSG